MSKILELGGFVGNILEAFFDPPKTIKKIINKAGELSKKVTLNDMIETANFPKNVINASKKVFGGNNPNKQWNKRYYESN